MLNLLPPILSAVLSHLLFHYIYPTSVSIPLLISAALVTITCTSWYPGDVVLALWTYIVSLSFSIVAYRLSPFHPLAGYPGPALAKVTKLWGVWNAWTGEQHRVFLRLHRKYGPFVRTGPDEISVADVSAVTDVLGAGGIPKGEYYTIRQDPTAPNNLIAMTGDDHDNRRRLWNRGMSHDSLKEYESLIARRGNELVDRLRAESCTIDHVDIVRWIDYFSFDFMGDMAFGGGFNLVKDGEDKRGFRDLLDTFIHSTNASSHIPWATHIFMDSPLLKRRILAFRAIGVNAAKMRIKAGTMVKDLWYHLSDEAELEKTRPPAQNVIADGALAMIAGSDTTSSALASFFYFALTHPECYKRLREEIDRVHPPGSDSMDTSRHDQLVWVNACISETLRLAPPVPTNGPRQVPYASQGATVAGRFVPPGTQVYVPPYVLHRDSRYFSPSPDSFDPTRWLSAPDAEAGATSKGEGAILNQLAFIPFSYGPANCVGRHLAQLEMRTVICTLMHKFDFALADADGAGVARDQSRWLDGLRDYLITARRPLWVKVAERATC